MLLNNAREYYKNNRELIKERARNRYKSLTEDKKQKMKDYQKKYRKKYREAKKLNNKITNKTPLGETGCLSGCLGIQFFDSPRFPITVS